MTVIDPVAGAKYLQENGIPLLIEDILRELLTDQPVKPIPYISNMLTQMQMKENSASSGDLQAQCAALLTQVNTLQAQLAESETRHQAEVRELQLQCLDMGRKHAEHVASVRRLMADVSKKELVQAGRLHADHTALVRQMMSEVTKKEAIRLGRIHADHSAMVRQMMDCVVKKEAIRLGHLHANHCAMIRLTLDGVVKKELIRLGRVHADHTASVRTTMQQAAQSQQIELGRKHANHTASVRALLTDLLHKTS